MHQYEDVSIWRERRREEEGGGRRRREEEGGWWRRKRVEGVVGGSEKGEGEEGEISFVERENVKNIQTNKICYCLGKCKTSPLKTLPSFCCKKKWEGLAIM